jgi:hypothetical protein
VLCPGYKTEIETGIHGKKMDATKEETGRQKPEIANQKFASKNSRLTGLGTAYEADVTQVKVAVAPAVDSQ